jgi:hypothetical protein
MGRSHSIFRADQKGREKGLRILYALFNVSKNSSALFKETSNIKNNKGNCCKNKKG